MKIDKCKIYWSMKWLKYYGNENYKSSRKIEDFLLCSIVSSGPKFTIIRKKFGTIRLKTPDFFNVCIDYGDPVYE